MTTLPERLHLAQRLADLKDRLGADGDEYGACDLLTEAAQALQAAPEGGVLVPVGRGQDERVNDDSFRALIHGFRSQIGARRPDNDEPEDQWAWDKATALVEILNKGGDK